MADSEDKKPFLEDSESTVRLDLNALKMEPEPEEPLLDVDAFLSEGTDLTSSAPATPTSEPASGSGSADDLEQQLDALANDVFSEETSFEERFAAPREETSFDSDKTVILGPESMISEGKKPAPETPSPDETVSITPAPLQQEPQEELPLDQTVSTEPKRAPSAPAGGASATGELEHQATQRLEFPLPEFNEPLDELLPDTEHPSWQYAQLEHPEEYPHPEKAAAPKAETAPEPKPAKKAKPAKTTPKAPYPTHPPVQPSTSEPSGGRRLPVLLSLTVAILGLLAGAAGVWMAMESDERAASLQRDLNAMEVRMIQLRKKSPDTTPLEKRIRELEAELAAARTAPASMPEAKVAAPATPTKPQPPVAVKAEKPKPAAAPATVAPKTGNWVVYISSHASQTDAVRELQRLKAAGVPAELRSAEVRGSTWHRIVASGFTSKEAAAGYASEIKRDFNIRGTWIGKEK